MVSRKTFVFFHTFATLTTLSSVGLTKYFSIRSLRNSPAWNTHQLSCRLSNTHLWFSIPNICCYQWEKDDDKIKEVPRFSKVVMPQSEHLHEHLRRENYNKPGEKKTASEDCCHFRGKRGWCGIFVWTTCLGSNWEHFLAWVDQISRAVEKICRTGLAFKQISLPIHCSRRRRGTAWNMN